MPKSYVYILGNNRPTLYIEVTNNLMRRVFEHKEEIIKGFTSKYQLKKLLYFEEFADINLAFEREKHIKHWKRDWKIELIKKTNPNLDDLYFKLL